MFVTAERKAKSAKHLPPLDTKTQPAELEVMEATSVPGLPCVDTVKVKSTLELVESHTPLPWRPTVTVGHCNNSRQRAHAHAHAQVNKCGWWASLSSKEV